MIGLLAGVLTLLQQPAVPARSAATLLVDAVAVDGRGTPIADLKPAEFELWINRYRIPIESVRFVSPETSPAKGTMVLLLDDMAATPELAARVREAARQFVSRLADGETIAIVPLNGEPIQPTGDRPRLISAIDSYRVRAFPFRPDDAGAHVLTTIASISRQLMEGSEGRKTIVGIGVSWLFDRPLPPPNRSRDLRPEWIDAMRATAAAHASVYVVDPAPVGRAPYPDAGQSGFARETGGRAFVGTNDTGDVAERIWREARTYYLIEVADPPIGRKDPLRELEVRVLRRGVTVRARSAIEP
jgi:VWFA-related protein